MDSTLRVYLEALRKRTTAGTAIPNPGFWVGDAGDERRVLDDLAAGRLNLRAAYQHAVHGLEALDAGDLEMALTRLCEGNSLLIDALARRIRPQDRPILTEPAKKRGRPRKN